MSGLSLELRDLEWSFAPTEAPFLRIPSLDLRAGETLAIAGPSGSGKSSLLFILAAMEAPSRGLIRWGEVDVASLGEGRTDAWRLRNLGMVFQDFRLVPELSALENVLLPTSFSAWAPSRDLVARAASLLERVGLDPRERRKAGTLSRGEMQRVAVARALIFDPPLLMADEPTASLDEASGDTVAELLLGAARESGTTLVIATHHRPLRERADRILHLEHGTMAGTARGGNDV
jgi:putative ABC transport system ATP-binding protein